jgi:hypothetical protein
MPQYYTFINCFRYDKSEIIRSLYLLGFQMAPRIGFSVWPPRAQRVHGRAFLPTHSMAGHGESHLAPCPSILRGCADGAVEGAVADVYSIKSRFVAVTALPHFADSSRTSREVREVPQAAVSNRSKPPATRHFHTDGLGGLQVDTNSNFEACSTGRSAVFAPLKILAI